MNTKLRLFLGMWLLLAVAACGPQPAHTASHSPSARLTPSTSAPAPPSATPSPSPSAQPVPVAPPPPLVVVRSPNGMVAATTADGAFVWSFDPRTLAIANPVLVTSGPNLFAYGEGKVAVIDRAGTVIGHGMYTGDHGGYPVLFPAPTGIRWAWTTLDTTPVYGTGTPTPAVSSLWVAGVGQRPTRVRTWTGGYEVIASQWSDAGIVIIKATRTCGLNPQSSALVDPTRGAETALFGADRWPLDVKAGLRVAMGVNGGSLYVMGTARITRTYPLPIAGAGVDPSGSRLYVSTFGVQGCGGQPKAATSVIAVASNTQTTIDGFFADAWLDDQHLLGRSLVTFPAGGMDWGSRVRIADLSGHRSDLVMGRLVGVLRSQSL
jgi:hypothetical protein